MVRSITWIFLLTAGTLAVLGMSSKRPVPSTTEIDALTIFLTGNELGTMKPCGCSGGQLGGLDRRLAILDSVPKSKRLILDTGSLVESDSTQDLIKFNVIIQALDLLGYDLVNLTEEDVRIGTNIAILDSISSLFNVISSARPPDVNIPVKFTKQLSLQGKTIIVTVAAFNPDSTPLEQLKKLFPPRPGLRTANILIINRCDTEIIESILRMNVVDCLVCPPQSDEPIVIREPNDPYLPGLVVSAGRLGKYVGKLQIRSAKDKLKFSFSTEKVSEDLPQAKPLVELYQTYQQLVKEADLLEKHPRFELPGSLEYTGSKSCKLCHEYEYEKWSTKAHARAYATLRNIGSQFDPECVVCHVIGMNYNTGFVSEQSTPDLKDVGCENCHGPGSEHISSLGKAQTTQPQSDCVDCHTPENSADYAGNELHYFEEIVHWREPNAMSNVK